MNVIHGLLISTKVTCYEAIHDMGNRFAAMRIKAIEKAILGIHRESVQ